MYGKGTIMDYETVPTTVFTPLEYGSCGFSEEAAKSKFGEENIESYHSRYDPLEWVLQARDADQCYAKIVCLKSEKVRLLMFQKMIYDVISFASYFELVYLLLYNMIVK